MFRGERPRRVGAACALASIVLATTAAPGDAGESEVGDLRVPPSEVGDADLVAPRGAAVPPAAANPTGSVGPATVPEDLAAEGWQLVLDEEFDGGTLDESLWRPMNAGGVYHGQGLSVDDTYPGEADSGFLTMTTFSREDRSGTLRHYDPRITTGSSGKGWATAEAGFLPAYGYVEARIKMDKEPGTKTAFWLMPRSGHGSPFRDPGDSGPEFTIVEWGSDLQGGMHWDELRWQGGENHIQEHYEGVGDHPGDATRDDAFHVWSALWTPDGYRMFFDGEEYLHSDYGVTYNPEQLILSMHAGNPPSGGYGDLDESTNQMVVDYVRWWQRPVSSIPDQSTAVNQPLSVPFSVTDHFSSSTEHAYPGSVRVTASSSNQDVVPDSGLSVAGNGPADPDASLTNADFEDSGDDLNDPQGWYQAGGDPSVWDGDAHTGDHSLRLEGRDDSGSDGDPPLAGGRAEQTISGLEPGTSYMLGTRFNHEVDWEDNNNNGYVDCGDEDEIGPCASDDETLEPIHASGGRFDWGVVDVDVGRAGDQTVSWVRNRNAWRERGGTRGGRVNQREFREDNLVFTTGPDTTEVTVYFDNTAYAGTDDASNVSIDSLYLRPMVPPHRTLTVQPEDGAVGETTVTLTAVDEDDRILGTREVHLSVDDHGSLTNGSFEAYPQGDGWDLPELSDVVVDNPFSPDQVLELAYEEPAEPSEEHDPVARQPVSGLEPGVTYALEFMAKGGLVYNVEHDNTNACSGFGCVVSTGDWEAQSVTFTAGPSGSGIIEILDPFDDDTTALVDDVRVIPDTPTPADRTAPGLLDLEEQRAADGVPHTILVDQLGMGIESVTSSNQDVLPSRSIALAGEGRYGTISFTPLPYRTGTTTLTFTYSEGGSTETFDLPVVVSDERLHNPGFEDDTNGWELPPGASLVGDGQQRTGSGALEVGDTGGTPVSGDVPGLQYNTPFQLSGYVDGEVNVMVITNQPEYTDHPETVTATWSGSGWNEGDLMFTPGQCSGCAMTPGGFNYEGARQNVTIRIEDADPGDGPSIVDDLSISYAPNLPTIPEASLPESQTEVHYRDRHGFAMGHVPWNIRWREDELVNITSSDEAVVPADNILLNPDHPAIRIHERASRPFDWLMVPIANEVTGRSDITLTLSDPSTGASSSETWPVTVNAGTFDNGDFERRMDGWDNMLGGFRRDDVRFRRPWGHLGADYDRVLRMWLGRRGYQVRDLDAAEQYVLQGNAFGAGSQVIVKANDDATPWDGRTLAEVSVDNPDEWAAFDELRFTPLPDDPTTPGRDESDVWIFIDDGDYDPGTSVVEEDPACRETGDDAVCRDAELWNYYDYYPCRLPRVGMTCFDDLGLFRAADID